MLFRMKMKMLGGLVASYRVLRVISAHAGAAALGNTEPGSFIGHERAASC